MKTVFVIKRRLDQLAKLLIFIFMFVMCMVVFWQIISRFLLNNPSIWSEEVARYCMVWIALLGSGMAMQHNGHMSLVLVTGKIKNPNAKKTIFMFDRFMCIVFAVILIFYGIQFTQLGFAKMAASIKISMGMVYLALPVGGIFLLLNILESVYRAFQTNAFLSDNSASEGSDM